MVFNTKGGKWILCPMCGITIFTASKRKHTCPPKVKEVMEQEHAQWAEWEMADFDKNLRRFWKENDVKFYKYLAEEGEI